MNSTADTRPQTGRTPFSPRFPEELRKTLRQGRWLLVAAETLVSLFVLAQLPPLAVRLSLLAFGLYNVASLIALRRPVMPRFQVPVMLGLDLCFVLLMAWLTGGVQSPFIVLCYLVILAAALWYDLKGGVAIAIMASVAAIVMGTTGAVGTPPIPLALLLSPQEKVLNTLIPSFLLAGGFTGYLVQHLKTYYERNANARLREQATSQEMSLARQVQEASLPAQAPTLPGLECAFLSRSAGEVGGDFLLFLDRKGEDTETCPVSCLTVVIGDVSGKGISAALASTGITHLLPWLHPLENPGGALKALNDDLNERLPDDFYATLLLTQISNERVRFWSAGHPPALLWRASLKRVINSQEVSDPPLGLFPFWEAHPEENVWEAGDVLLLYTDGASEARNHDGAQFTAERLAAALSSHPGASASDIVEDVYHAINEWGTPSDDLTLVVCKCVAQATSSGG
jgi:serine phosphatase RsbU (regulator of sigma subunit)